MTTTTGPIEVWVEYRQFYLADPGLGTDPVPSAGAAQDGVLATADDAALILTGLHTGNVSVTVQPAHVDPDTAPGTWEHIIEATFTSTTGTLVVHGYEDGPLEDLPNLTPHGPGTYHLRLHNRGRAHARALDTTDPDDDSGEHYLLQTWPSPYDRLGARSVRSAYGGRALPDAHYRVIGGWVPGRGSLHGLPGALLLGDPDR
ncbi:hypothetical protein [Streptomyces sp. NPDC058657]|uniref:hypothetical protein n=1 Tax=unclassified Streptomyces TaxID=2593676 RepID=UPI003662999A